MSRILPRFLIYVIRQINYGRISTCLPSGVETATALEPNSNGSRCRNGEVSEAADRRAKRTVAHLICNKFILAKLGQSKHAFKTGGKPGDGLGAADLAIRVLPRPCGLPDQRSSLPFFRYLARARGSAPEVGVSAPRGEALNSPRGQCELLRYEGRSGLSGAREVHLLERGAHPKSPGNLEGAK